MNNSNANESNKPILESEKPRKTYEPPKLMRFECCDIASGDTNVPESSNGMITSAS